MVDGYLCKIGWSHGVPEEDGPSLRRPNLARQKLERDHAGDDSGLADPD